MQKNLLPIILLVISWYVIAHAKTWYPNKKQMTSLLSKEDGVKNQLNLEDNVIITIQTPSSAVQDWSLVCQQLCGAALGGVACAPYCKTLPFLPYKVQLDNAEKLMDSKINFICPELCGIQLGDDVCTCKKYITNDFDVYMKIEDNRNVCAIICDYTSVTLTGCTPCNRDRNIEYMTLENVKPFNKKALPFKTYNATPSPTPDWNQLCATLCKTGDGGSLCNCDLSPFAKL